MVVIGKVEAPKLFDGLEPLLVIGARCVVGVGFRAVVEALGCVVGWLCEPLVK